MAEHLNFEADRPLSIWALLGLWVTLATLLAMTLSGMGYRWDWWSFRFSIQIFRYAFYAAFAAAGASLLGFLLSLWERAWRRVLWSLLGLAICAPMIWMPLNLWYTAQRVPRIHDITTDTEDPPRFIAILPLRKNASNPATYSGGRVTRLQKAGYPHLKPAILKVPPIQVFKNALATALEMGWEIAAAVPGEGRIEATDTTFWFGFKDDIVIRVRPEGEGARLDIRSKSRVGRSDLGKNAERIDAFLQKFQEMFEKK